MSSALAVVNSVGSMNTLVATSCRSLGSRTTWNRTFQKTTIGNTKIPQIVTIACQLQCNQIVSSLKPLISKLYISTIVHQYEIILSLSQSAVTIHRALIMNFSFLKNHIQKKMMISMIK